MTTEGRDQPGLEAIAAAFAGEGRRAALMPYMMGGFPDMDTSRRIAEAYADGGADLVELGFPFSDPLADGPVIHAAGTAALRAGATTHEVLAVGRALAERVPVVAMVYANLVMARGLERFADDLVAHGISGLIVPDLPLEESDGVRAACDAAGVALVPLVAPTTPDERMARIGASARGFVYAVSVDGHDRRARRAGRRRSRTIVARAKAATEVPVALGFGIGTPEQAREAADAGADGVIVGSRLVRAVGARREDAAGRRPRAGGAVRPGPQVESRPHMGLVVVTTVGLVVWLVMWALGDQGHRRVHDHRAAGAPGRDGAHHRPLPAGQPRQLTDGFDDRSVARHLRASIDSRAHSVSLSLRRETCEHVPWQLRAAS